MRKLLRVLFSRYSACAVIIATELSLFVSILILAESLGALISVSALLSFLGAIHLVNRDSNPEYKIPWLAAILIFPYVGVTLYALFFSRRVTKKEIRLGREILSFLPKPDGWHEVLSTLRDEGTAAYGMVRAIMHDDINAAVFSDTRSLYFPSGEEYYAHLLLDLATASEYIYLEFFIIEEGKMWDGILDILKEKAISGVDVRVLYDDIGCMKTLPRGYDKRLSSLGIKCKVFGKITPKITTVHNNRDHRKIAVIDGRVAYTGGVNIADEYIGEKIRFGHWKDGGVRVEGGAAFGFAGQFLAAWAYTARSLDLPTLSMPAYAPEISDGGYYVPFCTGPYPLYDSPGKNLFLNIINQAREYVYVTTPYLIVDFDLTEALCCAAERGVDVRIITPGIADKKTVKIMTESSYPHLLKSGVGIFEYERGFLHEKLLISDDLYAVVGSINFDYRSLAHHFEDAIFIYKTPSVISMRDGFLRTQDLSKEEVGNERPRFFEWVLRIIIKICAPLL